MKHIKQITTVFIGALFMAVAIFYSCSKQEITDQPVTGNGEVTMSEGDLNIFNKIVSFKDKITYIRENPSYKSGEFTTVDSAVWYLDATLNLSHAFISWETLAGFYYDSVFHILSTRFSKKFISRKMRKGFCKARKEESLDI